jgi:bud site selection protein 20
MGRPQRRSRTTVKDKAGTKARRTRRRTKDIDQIQDEISRASKSAPSEQRPIDPEKPGLGQFMCVYCDAYFISDVVMQEHLRSKPHKKRFVLLFVSIDFLPLVFLIV